MCRKPGTILPSVGTFYPLFVCVCVCAGGANIWPIFSLVNSQTIPTHLFPVPENDSTSMHPVAQVSLKLFATFLLLSSSHPLWPSSHTQASANPLDATHFSPGHCFTHTLPRISPRLGLQAPCWSYCSPMPPHRSYHPQDGATVFVSGCRSKWIMSRSL